MAPPCREIRLTIVSSLSVLQGIVVYRIIPSKRAYGTLFLFLLLLLLLLLLLGRGLADKWFHTRRAEGYQRKVLFYSLS